MDPRNNSLNSLNEEKTTTLIRRIEKGLFSTTGKSFFEGLAGSLHTLLGTDYVLICEPITTKNGTRTARSIVFFDTKGPQSEICFELDNTPCEKVIDEDEYYCESDVAKQFPEFPVLTEWGINSYYGLAIKNTSGHTQGHFALLFKQPLIHVQSLRQILQAFIPRVSTELEQFQADFTLTQYKHIVSATSDMLAYISTDFIYKVVNPAYCHTFGKTPDELLGQSPIVIFGEEAFNNIIKPNLVKSLNGKKITNIVKVSLPDGEQRFLKAKIAPVYRANGKISGAVVCATDITDIKKSEQEQKLKANILEGLAKGETIKNLLTQITSVVDELGKDLICSILLLDPATNRLRLGAAPGLPDEYNQAIDNLLIGDGVGSCGTSAFTGKRVIVSDISTHPYWSKSLSVAKIANVKACWSEPIFSSKGLILGTFALYYRTIREPSEHELNLLTSFAPLAAIVIERHREKTEREKLETQLRQAQKMEAIGQLTGGIAHDFNNILGSILGFSNLAKTLFSDHPNEKLDLYLSEIIHAGERARDLVNQMLTYSRSGLNTPIPLAINPTVGNALVLLRPMLPSLIDFNVAFNDGELFIYADPGQIEQVIVNLCINARDAIEETGDIDITVHKLEVNKHFCSSCHAHFEGSFVQLSIHDNGEGISHEHLDKIFDPFFSTKDIGKGSGMGLSMVHGIVHEYAGHVRVESSKNEGTTVSLLFPVYHQPESTPPRPIITDNWPPPTNKSIRILIVDDEESLVLLHKEILSNAGFRVTHANSGKNALQRIIEEPDTIDLLITDMTMPKMSGMELTRAVHAIHPNIPVIMCSGFPIQTDRMNEPGIRKYLHKPVATAELISAISEIFEHSEE